MRVEGPVFLKFALLVKSYFRMEHVALAHYIFTQEQTKKLAFKIRVLFRNSWEKTVNAHPAMTISTIILLTAFKIPARDQQSFKSMENVLKNVQVSIYIMRQQMVAPSNAGKIKPLIMARTDASVLNTTMSTAKSASKIRVKITII